MLLQHPLPPPFTQLLEAFWSAINTTQVHKLKTTEQLTKLSTITNTECFYLPTTLHTHTKKKLPVCRRGKENVFHVLNSTTHNNTSNTTDYNTYTHTTTAQRPWTVFLKSPDGI